MHERGYRFTWPPKIEDLTPRQVRMIQLADQAEAYINHQESERARNPESVSHDQYDVNQSRKEWLDEVNHGV